MMMLQVWDGGHGALKRVVVNGSGGCSAGKGIPTPSSIDRPIGTVACGR